VHYRHASRASQGARSYQEDSVVVWPLEGSSATGDPDAAFVAVLADGMGGHAGGALASGIICETFLTQFAEARGPADKRLSASLEAANEAIRAQVDNNNRLAGMGATLVGVAFGEAGAHWISVGDSPMYLMRRGDRARLNEDHSLSPVIDKLVAEGKLDAEEARHDPRRHYLRSAVTGDDLDLIDQSEKPLALAPGDIVIIASDGLLTLDEEHIQRIVQAYATDGAKSVADALMRAVDQAGDPRQDNTTIVVVTVDPDTP
jgi:serine/threonine protein phosphatase PrpC